MENEYFHDYNAFRIRPTHKSPMLPYQFLLYELTNSIKYALSDLCKLHVDRYKIIHTNSLANSISHILNWTSSETKWNYDAAYKSCLKRHDSVYDKNDRSDLADYARSIFYPYRGEIESDFLTALTGKGLDSSYLPSCLDDPFKAISRYR
jgi:hypothetical protein